MCKYFIPTFVTIFSIFQHFSFRRNGKLRTKLNYSQIFSKYTFSKLLKRYFNYINSSILYNIICLQLTNNIL